MNSFHVPYDTGWVACSDWTNQHLGDTVGANVVHNFHVPLSKLLVGVFISTDGTDAASFVVPWGTTGSSTAAGITVFQVDSNNLKIQTHTNGFCYINDNGDTVVIAAQSYYYKVKVWYMG